MYDKRIFISYSEDSKTHIDRIRKISNHLQSLGYTVYFYADAPAGTNNMEFMQNITICDATLIIGTKKYKEKACQIKRGGIWFESGILSIEYMNSHYDRIIPVAFDDFNESFPEPFSLNKGIRVKRVDKYALTSISAMLANKFGYKN